MSLDKPWKEYAEQLAILKSRGMLIGNVSAHHSILWNSNIVERASPLKEDVQLSKLRTERAFLYFCMMQKLLLVICPNSNWGMRFPIFDAIRSV